MSAFSAEEDACDVPLISPCPAQALYAKYGPVADGALRIPTPEQELVWNKACSDCIMLAQALYAKYGPVADGALRIPTPEQSLGAEYSS